MGQGRRQQQPAHAITDQRHWTPSEIGRGVDRPLTARRHSRSGEAPFRLARRVSQQQRPKAGGGQGRIRLRSAVKSST
jgi:hypothetical protein